MADTPLSIRARRTPGYYARRAEGRGKPRFLDLRRPKSNFDLVEIDYRGLVTMRRILSQVRQHGGTTAVIEDLNEPDEIREENDDIRLRFPDLVPGRLQRISFFAKNFTTARGLAGATSHEFLGYIILKEDYIPGMNLMPRIYESVLRLSRHENNYVRGEREWDCLVGGKAFQAKGFLYAQQNALTNICAHVAIKTVLGRFPDARDISYREMNRLVGVDHISRKVGIDGGGLNPQEMRDILEVADVRCMVMGYAEPQPDNVVPFQKVLYGSIESGYPAIVIFQTTDNPNICHAVPVFGHTFNEDTWVYRAESSYFRVGPGTQYIPSESWVSMYIAHDDNWGSNFCIPRRYLHTQRYCDKLPEGGAQCVMDSGCVLYVIGTLPGTVEMNALQAEVIGVDYLFSMLPQLPDLSEVWRKRLCYYAEQKQLVVRPILVQGREYIGHLRKISDWAREKLEFTFSLEPKSFFWMVELSVPELFSANKRKVGEVVLRAESAPTSHRDFKNLLLARVPGFFAVYVGGPPSSPRYDFVPCRLQSHVELYGCEESP